MMSIAAFLILTVEVALGQVPISLDMAENSVDDQYHGCRDKMFAMVVNNFGRDVSGSTRFAWQDGLKNVKLPEDKLTWFHSFAIAVYTGPYVHADFNTATRGGKADYTSKKYKWHSLNFFLTDAIQILKKTQTDCKETYRGTHLKFSTTVNTEIRFGSFTSSSLDRTMAENFKTKSCFEIQTCEGAYVAKYSVRPKEEEVLIPPYETFKVTAVLTTNHTWFECETVYKLKSSGKRSDLNCAVFYPMFLQAKL